METLSRRKMLTGLAAAFAGVAALGARALGLGRRGGAAEGALPPSEPHARPCPSIPVRPAAETVKRRG